jgi:hypothetical protein
MNAPRGQHGCDTEACNQSHIRRSITSSLKIDAARSEDRIEFALTMQTGPVRLSIKVIGIATKSVRRALRGLGIRRIAGELGVGVGTVLRVTGETV